MIKQLTQLVDRVTDVGTQHVFAKKLVKHLPHRAFQKRHPARMPRTVPGIGAVGGILEQLAKERRRQAVEIRASFANDMPGDEFGRIFEHVNKAMQFAQNIVRDMT